MCPEFKYLKLWIYRYDRPGTILYQSWIFETLNHTHSGSCWYSSRSTFTCTQNIYMMHQFLTSLTFSFIHYYILNVWMPTHPCFATSFADPRVCSIPRHPSYTMKWIWCTDANTPHLLSFHTHSARLVVWFTWKIIHFTLKTLKLETDRHQDIHLRLHTQHIYLMHLLIFPSFHNHK